MTDQITRLNFRDIGGLPTEAGGFFRSGLFYRTEGPKNFVGKYLEDLKALGVRAIFDLRSDGERERDPHDWHDDDCQWLALDMNTDLRAADTTEWERLRDLLFSEPVMPFRMVLFQRAGESYPWQTLADLAPYRVTLAGGDALFTGDSLMIVACASRRITP